ncbi:MAG: ribosomal RNA small subunit methyltransferase A [Thermoplasmata archaeon]|nr:MAG: ribosomal RNA small subunit methyltransferase A [Thermoplasmata archaeon]
MVEGMGIEDIKLYRGKGQYILMDKDVIYRQVDYAKLTKKDTVLEIGPGMGALTFKLAEKAKKVVAIEKDHRLFSYLAGRIPENVELVNEDVLEMELPKFEVVVSNLPYQISSPVTFKLLKHEFRRAILMYQREFAERMTAKALDNDYCRLSVNVYYRAECSILEFVSKEAFYPKPKVDSAIIELVPRKPPFEVKNEEMFFKVVDTLFGQRRKKIKNPLIGLIRTELKKSGAPSKSSLNEIINDIPFKDERVEKLSPEKIALLADNLFLTLSDYIDSHKNNNAGLASN